MSFRDIFRRRKPAPRRPRQADVEPDPVADVAFLRRLDRLVLKTSRLLRGQSVGERTSWRRLPSSDFREHRQYLPGDDLRHVDWNASARSEHMFVKLGERPREVTVHVLVDNTASMAWGRPSKLYAARRLAAAVGYLALSHGDRLLLSTLSDSSARFGPAHGKGRVPGLLRAVRELPRVRRADLLAAARRYTAGQPQGGYAVIISDLLSLPELVPVLEAFPAPTWQLLVLHVLHPAELDPTLRGEVELLDTETGERANYDLDARAIEKYQANVRAWCQSLEQACFDAGAMYARVLSDWPIEQAVLPYLRRRGVVQPA